MTNIELKKSLRSKIKAALKNLPPQDVLKKRCDAACKKICATEQFNSSEYVFVYMNMKNEADCLEILNNSIKQKKKVCIPKVLSGTQMEFYLLSGDGTSIKDNLVSGAFGILEPAPSMLKNILNPEDLAGKNVLMIVPGLAFTKSGERLGRGKGYYDRYIERLSLSGAKLCTVGFCFSEQIVQKIPCDEFDKKVDFVFEC
jgi:5-formyltetrahydrofolate cyclo-ligase